MIGQVFEEINLYFNKSYQYQVKVRGSFEQFGNQEVGVGSKINVKNVDEYQCKGQVVVLFIFVCCLS